MEVANSVEDQPQTGLRTLASGSIRKGGEAEFLSLSSEPRKRKKAKVSKMEGREFKKPMLFVEECGVEEVQPLASPALERLRKPDRFEESEPETPAPLLSPAISSKDDEFLQTLESPGMEPPILSRAVSLVEPESSGMEKQVAPCAYLSEQPGTSSSIDFGSFDIGDLNQEDPLIQQFCSQGDDAFTGFSFSGMDLLPYETGSAVETTVPESEQEIIREESRKPLFTTEGLSQFSMADFEKNPALTKKFYKIAIANCQRRIDESGRELDALNQKEDKTDEDRKEAARLFSRVCEYNAKKVKAEELLESVESLLRQSSK